MSVELTDKIRSFTVDDIELIPQQGVIRSRSDIRLSPFLYSAPMDTVTGYDLTAALSKLGHYPVVSRFLPHEEWSACVHDFAGDPDVFFAVGMDWEKTIFDMNKIAAEDNPISLALDVAHGDNVYALKAIKDMSVHPFVDNIMSGSIATPGAALRSAEAGATYLRIGIAGGSACTTSLMTGCGVRNAYAVYSIHQYLMTTTLRRKHKLIADGGIRYPGDAVKLMALGADGVMIGRIFSKAEESAGWETNDIGQLVKSYRGQASSEFQKDVLGYVRPCSEGVAMPPQTWDMRTHVSDIVNEYEAGMQSAISYLGLTTNNQLPYADIEFMFLTHSGQKEIQPHGLTTEYKR